MIIQISDCQSYIWPQPEREEEDEEEYEETKITPLPLGWDVYLGDVE